MDIYFEDFVDNEETRPSTPVSKKKSGEYRINTDELLLEEENDDNEATG